MVSVGDGEKTLATYEYYADGSLWKKNVNGIFTEYRYTPGGMLALAGTGVGFNTEQSETYEYRLDGNMIVRTSFSGEITGTVTDRSEYIYDSLSRLINEKSFTGGNLSADWSADYTYDDYNNRSTMTKASADSAAVTHEYGYNKANRLTDEYIKERVSATEMRLLEQNMRSYDSAGNMTAKMSNKMAADGSNAYTLMEKHTYDALDRVSAIDYNGTETFFAYDANNQRLKKTTNGNITYHAWDGDNIVFDSIVNKDGTLHEMSYIFGANGVEGYCKDNSPDFYSYYITARGDVSAVRDKDGNYNNYEYDAFGNDTGSDTAFVSPYRYTGQYYDAETDKYYLRARYYDASMGRFTQEDTYLGEGNDPFSVNRYTYCENNPIKYIDPSGHYTHVYKGGKHYAKLQKGDTLWKIALNETGNGLNWKKIGYKGNHYKLKIGQLIDLTKLDKVKTEFKVIGIASSQEKRFSYTTEYNTALISRTYYKNAPHKAWTAKTVKDFKKIWDRIGSADVLVIEGHGSPKHIWMSETESVSVEDVNKLANKKIKLIILLGCTNASLKERWSNLAFSFSQVITGTAIGADGTVWLNKVVKSANDARGVAYLSAEEVGVDLYEHRSWVAYYGKGRYYVSAEFKINRYVQTTDLVSLLKYNKMF